MKILYLFHESPQHPFMRSPELERRLDILSQIAGRDSEVHIRALADEEFPNASSFDGMERQGRRVVELVSRTADQYDAVVIGCFSDPGYEEARTLVKRVPIVAPGRASLLVASVLGERVGVLTTSPKSQLTFERMMGTLGIDDHTCTVGYIGLGAEDVARDELATMESLIRNGQGLISKGVQALTLGCMSLGFMLDTVDRLQTILGIPVINPVRVAIVMAKLLSKGHFISHPKELVAKQTALGHSMGPNQLDPRDDTTWVSTG